jgi:hypothetical protein
VDGSGSLATFDDYADVELVRAADLSLAGLIDTEFGHMLRYNRADVERAGLAEWGVDDGGREQVMWNLTRWTKLLSGGMWQQEGKIREQGQVIGRQDERIEQLSQRNRELEARLAKLERRMAA